MFKKSLLLAISLVFVANAQDINKQTYVKSKGCDVVKNMKVKYINTNFYHSEMDESDMAQMNFILEQSIKIHKHGLIKKNEKFDVHIYKDAYKKQNFEKKLKKNKSYTFDYHECCWSGKSLKKCGSSSFSKLFLVK